LNHVAYPRRFGRSALPRNAIAARASVARNEGKNKFLTHAERNAFLQRFVADYNRTRLKCLDYKAPAELLLNPPGPNTMAAIHEHEIMS
jgi:hypothetical protein